MATLLESYKGEIKRLELVINNIAEESELDSFQELLNSAFDKYEGEKSIGKELYKLYEYQARVYHAKGMDNLAKGFIDKAIEIRGETYKKAIEIKASLADVDNKNIHASNKKSLKGIGGWLAVYIVILVINVIAGIYMISRGNSTSVPSCAIIDNAYGSGTCAEMVSMIEIEMIMNFISIICAIISIILIFMKKKVAVAFTVFYSIFGILIQIFELSVMNSWSSRFSSSLYSSSDYTKPVAAIIWNIVYIAYFLRSQRVKETLVEY